MLEVDRHIRNILDGCLNKIETHFDADVIFFYGEIDPAYDKVFRDFIEELKQDPVKRNRLAVILNTPGGSAETTEKMVDIIRYHYDEVYFIIPDYAMSAGTILSMSGNKIYMDYSSSLGPIDPQIRIGNQYVPALGYLDKVNEMLEKAANNKLTNAEFAILQGQDLALLRSYEQAKDLTVSLLKEWLVKYKFSTWTNHRTDPAKIGNPVTLQEKEDRAAEIAVQLGDNKKWHSHGRNIGIKKLNELRLEIDDYSTDLTLRDLIRNYNDVLTDYIGKGSYQVFMHSRTN